tara:strand:- start:169 stop:648 length:480 start_codon:yes stop_codon:yes gene_type:complete
MSAAPLQVAVTDGVACVRVNGPANVTLGVDFKAVVANACEQGGRVLLLDLTECVNMDSTFLGILLGMTGRLDRIELLNASERIRDLLDSLGVLELLHLGDGPNPFDDQLIAAERTDADKRELAKASLEAHRLLMEVNPDNVPKFRDVTKFLAEEVEGGA